MIPVCEKHNVQKSKHKCGYRCNRCINEANRRFIARNPDYYKRYQHGTNIKAHYGITKEQYQDILKKQDYRCAICQRHQNNFKKRLAIDHDHRTKKIRGLLCSSCNLAIGTFSYNPEIAKKFIDYLSKAIDGIPV